MISRLMLAGQVKMVGASSASAAFSYGSGASVNPASITIPALTGSQIAIIYLEVYTDLAKGFLANPPSGFPSATAGASTNASASGTGVNLSVAVAKICVASSGIDSTGTRVVSSLSNSQNKNSAFCTTTTGSQTISFSGSGNMDTNGNTNMAGQSHVQACVFIYTPPF